jgi:hypothetical protein
MDYCILKLTNSRLLSWQLKLRNIDLYSRGHIPQFSLVHLTGVAKLQILVLRLATVLRL